MRSCSGVLAEPHVLEQGLVGKCQFAVHSKGVVQIEVVLVEFEEEELGQLDCVRQTLKPAVHEASVAQVLQARQTTRRFALKQFVQVQLLQLICVARL